MELPQPTADSYGGVNSTLSISSYLALWKRNKSLAYGHKMIKATQPVQTLTLLVSCKTNSGREFCRSSVQNLRVMLCL